MGCDLISSFEKNEIMSKMKIILIQTDNARFIEKIIKK